AAAAVGGALEEAAERRGERRGETLTCHGFTSLTRSPCYQARGAGAGANPPPPAPRPPRPGAPPKPNASARPGVGVLAGKPVPSAKGFSAGVGWGRTSSPRGFAGGKGLDIGGGQRLAADPPVAALGFLDDHPGHRAHVFPFDGNHRVGELVDDLALL